MRVDLPAPDGPTTPSEVPGLDREGHVVEGVGVEPVP